MSEAENAETQERVVYDWLRSNMKFPNLWCPGCGIGTVVGAFTRALVKLGQKKEELVATAGIGCTGRVPAYLDCDTLHTTHGRALTFATGVKLANPNLKVVVFMGDGDALAIGGNHFIHACRRNIGLTAIVVNNAIYGMTGGQASPATPQGANTTTSPLGCIETPFDACALAIAAGATFVARSTVYHVAHLEKMICQALGHDGFALLEVLSPCPTSFGRLNKMGSPVEMLEQLHQRSVRHKPDLDVEQMRREGKDVVIGVLKQTVERKEYGTLYRETVVAKACVED
jgi:2-oxoglutarate ferredoxin oxidoreductase subunit beta